MKWAEVKFTNDGLGRIDLAEKFADGGALERARLTSLLVVSVLGERRASMQDQIGQACLHTNPWDGASDLVRYEIASEKRACNLLRDIFRNPFEEMPEFSPDWRTPDVLATAEAAYSERLSTFKLDPVRLGILADACEDAGCDSEIILRSLRGFDLCSGCMLPSPQEAEYGGGNYWCPACGGTEEGGPDVYWEPVRWARYRGFWPLDLILGRE